MSRTVSHQLTTEQRRQKRVRAKVQGTATRPRLSVQRSNKHMSVQAIDDTAGKTIVGVSELSMKKISGTKLSRAAQVAEAIAAKLQKMGIKKVSFDRGAFRYHGRVKAVADALRAQGIEL